MPLTLVVETGAGLANANAFASLAVVTTRLEAMPFAAAWADILDSNTQNQHIAEATAWLSRLQWDGLPTVSTQALAFPRRWVGTPDGIVLPANTIPAWLIDATARLAFWLSQQTATPFADNGLAPGTELALPGGLRLTPASSGGTMPPDVRTLIGPYVRGGSSLVRA